MLERICLVVVVFVLSGCDKFENRMVATPPIDVPPPAVQPLPLKPETQKIVRETIALIVEKDPSEISTDSTFNDLGCDDLDLIEIVMIVEERMEIQIKDEAIAREMSVRDFIERLPEATPAR